MSRHRDVRNMDYTEDYDGYDDIYGHSIDDDYYISPSNRQFIFNRENSRDQPKIGEFIRTEQDIQEEDEGELATDLSDLDKAKLESCIEQIKTTLGPLSISKNELVNIIISNNYDIEQATNAILGDPRNLQVEKKEKDVTINPSNFFIPKLNGLNENIKSPFTNKDTLPLKRFNIPSLSSLPSGENSLPPKLFTIPKLGSFSSEKSKPLIGANEKFDSLSDLVSNCLSKTLEKSLSVDCTDHVNVTQNFDKLKIHSSSSEVHSTPSQYQIDLSAALKLTPSTQSLPSKSKHDLREEKFEIPFVDCDVETETKTVLKCAFNIKDVLSVRLSNVKPVSNFGKVLCLKYRRCYRKRIKIHDVINSKRFNFATPSPDDAISKHLKK